MRSSTPRLLLMVAGLGSLGGLLMAQFMDAVPTGESLIVVAGAAGYVLVFLLI